MEQTKQTLKEKKVNPMREIKIEKVVLSVGGIGEDLEKGYKLLKKLSGRRPARMKSKKRIPTLNIRPGLEIGAVVTIRKDKEELLRKMLSANDNMLSRKQISENNFSFGVDEYIEIPGVEYDRDIGIKGLDITVVFKRTGKRVKLRKRKSSRIPKKQKISPEEIIKFMEEEFDTEFV